MDERTERNMVLESRRRSSRYPFSLWILPLFVFIFGLLIYIANNRDIVPSSTSSVLTTPGASPASGRIQVGVGGGPNGAKVSASPTPSKAPPTTQPQTTGTAY